MKSFVPVLCHFSSFTAAIKPGMAGVWLADLSTSLDPQGWPLDLNQTILWSFPAIPEDAPPREFPAQTIYSSGSAHATKYCGLLKTTQSDTAVMLITNGTSLNLDYCTVLKEGSPTNPFETYVWGYNSAILVKDGSRAALTAVNITTHNGAPGFLVDGRGYNPTKYLKLEEESRLSRRLEDGGAFQTSVSYSTFYSTGPWAPNILAQQEGFIYATRNTFFTSGHRSPVFEARRDSNIFCEGCLLHTQGPGSPLSWASTGTIIMRYSAGSADQSPVAVLDGNSTITFDTGHLTSHGSSLGGIVAFDSLYNTDYFGSVTLTDTWLVMTHPEAPAIWIGNTQTSLHLDRSHVEAESGVLLVANRSALSWTLQDYGQYSEVCVVRPGIVVATLSNLELRGDIIAMHGSKIYWDADKWVDWAGAATVVDHGEISVSLAEGSRWSLTGHSTVHELTGTGGVALPLTTFSGDLPELENIYGNGYNLHYLMTAEKNKWLNGREYALRNGGKLIPYESGPTLLEESPCQQNGSAGCRDSEGKRWIWPSLQRRRDMFQDVEE